MHASSFVLFECLVRMSCSKRGPAIETKTTLRQSEKRGSRDSLQHSTIELAQRGCTRAF
jgi:hypothetical protein